MTRDPCRSPFATRFASAWRSRVGSPSTHGRRRRTRRPASRRERRASARDVDALEPERERARGRRGSARCPAPAATASDERRGARGGRVGGRVRERRERRDRAPQLVRDDPEPLAAGPRRRSCLAPVRRRSAIAPAHARRARSAGRRRRGRLDERLVAVAPTFPSATSAFRRSQRGSLLGTNSRSSSSTSSVAVRLEPVGERDGRARASVAAARRRAASRPRGSRADVLADVAAVDAVAERVHDVLRASRPAVCVQYERQRVASSTPGSSSASGRARVDAERAAAAARVERRGRLELDVGDERAEHDPRAVRARDQHRVLADEADARALGAGPVDVLVRVDEHAIGAAEPRPSASRRSRRSA